MARVIRVDPRQDEFDIQQLDQLIVDPGYPGHKDVVTQRSRRRLDIAPVALGDLVDTAHQKTDQSAAAIGDDDKAVRHLLLADGAIAHRHRHVDHRNGGTTHVGRPQHGGVRVGHGRQLGIGHYLLHLESADGKRLLGREMKQQHAL